MFYLTNYLVPPITNYELIPSPMINIFRRLISILRTRTGPIVQWEPLYSASVSTDLLSLSGYYHVRVGASRGYIHTYCTTYHFHCEHRSLGVCKSLLFCSCCSCSCSGDTLWKTFLVAIKLQKQMARFKSCCRFKLVRNLSEQYRMLAHSLELVFIDFPPATHHPWYKEYMYAAYTFSLSRDSIESPTQENRTPLAYLRAAPMQVLNTSVTLTQPCSNSDIAPIQSEHLVKVRF